MPHLKAADAQKLIALRHCEWTEHQRHWRWLADSLEGGNRYRNADYTIDPTAAQDGTGYAPWYNYGYDAQTSQPIPISYRQVCDRNLVPHLREMGDDGRDIYILRLARTPVPKLVARAAEAHLSKIYAKEVTRDGPPALKSWWEDVDGKGSSIDQWMDEAVAPLLLTLGQVDIWFDHPEAPDGARIDTKADAMDLGLTDCVASILLPENLLWWRLDSRASTYAECLIFDRCEEGAGIYRHVTRTESNAYTAKGEFIAEDSRPHRFGVVPIVRVFDRRKVRCQNVGQSRYESIAEMQKAIYNAESERILSDVQQSHAQMMAPEEFLQSDNEIPIGPDRVLPMKSMRDGSGAVVGYQPIAYLDPPKGAQEAVRVHIQDMQGQADRDSSLAPPAGMTSAGSVGQSGISKIADQQDGNAILAKVAEVLATAEERFAAVALAVLSDGRTKPADLDSIEVTYPKQFELYGMADLSSALDVIQRAAQTAGLLPETEGELLKRIVALALPGLSDERLDELHGEVDQYLEEAAAEADEPPPDPEPADENILSSQSVVSSPGGTLITPNPA